MSFTITAVCLVIKETEIENRHKKAMQPTKPTIMKMCIPYRWAGTYLEPSENV